MSPKSSASSPGDSNRIEGGLASSAARYSRQIAVPGWSPQTQAKLARAEAVVVGIGGLGCTVATFLALAGVGTVCLCDGDVVELSNLNRQTLFTERDLGTKKAEAARLSLRELNASIHVAALCEYIDAGNVDRLVGSTQIVVDCLDNFDTRYLLNDYCGRRRIPLVHGSVSGMLGQATFLSPPETPCLRCLFSAPSRDAAISAIGAVCGILGSVQALETIKFLAGLGCSLKGRLLLLDGATMSISCLPVERRPLCPACQEFEDGRSGLE